MSHPSKRHSPLLEVLSLPVKPKVVASKRSLKTEKLYPVSIIWAYIICIKRDRIYLRRSRRQIRHALFCVKVSMQSFQLIQEHAHN